MLAAMLEYTRAGQPVIVTPFLLMGAMSPVTIPAALAQQTAEALAGVALIQLLRPGCPVVLGSFLSNIDMQSGSPMFGTPESAIGLYAGGTAGASIRAAVAKRRGWADGEPDC
jgi:trimethylamine--corrinoid protein Co-methyltransferase